MLKYKKLNIAYAKELREDMTEQERKLWYNFLKKCPVRFQRQKAIDNFIADFYCAGRFRAVRRIAAVRSDSILCHRIIPQQIFFPPQAL